MSSRVFFAAMIVMLLVAAASWAQAPIPISSAAATPAPIPAVASGKPETSAKPVRAAAPALAKPIAQVPLPVPDKGAFRILLSGTEVGTEQFEAASSGNAEIVRSETVIRVPGQPETRSSGELRVSADGTPLGYKWTAQSDKKASGSVEFADGAAKTFIDLGAGKDPFEQDFMFPSPHLAILDSNLHYQYALVALLYDWNAKGQQTFPVLIPQDVTPGTISVESMGSKTVEGSTFEALRVNTADLEVVAYFDARHRLMRLEVPAADVAVVRR
jgi:hypothetical protein